jgi:hypothetical protein
MRVYGGARIIHRKSGDARISRAKFLGPAPGVGSNP